MTQRGQGGSNSKTELTEYDENRQKKIFLLLAVTAKDFEKAQGVDNE